MKRRPFYRDPFFLMGYACGGGLAGMVACGLLSGLMVVKGSLALAYLLISWGVLCGVIWQSAGRQLREMLDAAEREHDDVC